MNNRINSIILLGFIGSMIWLSCKKEPKWNLIKTIPFVKTGQITEIKAKSTSASGELVHNAGLEVLKLGYCISQNKDSITIGNATVIELNSSQYDKNFNGHFKGSIQNLQENTIYYLRAFASNKVGTGYGEVISFKTLKLSQVITDTVVSIGTTSAFCSGIIVNDWGYAVNERGICYGTDTLPEYEKNISIGSGMGKGPYSCQLTFLSANKKYYYRAYGINQAGIAYGKCKSFTTLNIGTPKIITNSPYNISTYSASCGGSVTDDGGSFVTNRGICYSTSQNPTTTNSIVSSGTGTGTFNTNMSGLLAGNTYFVRAYAINAYGTAYGNEVSFTCNASIPSITTNNISNLTDVTCTSGGNITQDGGHAILQKGVCWSTSSNPTTSNTKTIDGNGNSAFISNVAGLNGLTTYYLRAYATNSLGTAYGNQVSFTTTISQTIPTVLTSASLTYGNYYASTNSNSNVTSDGNSTVTARGICWSTGATPTLANNFTLDGSGTGSYSSSLTNLTGSTKYYYRAYATNAKGTAYGSIYSFTTSASSLAALSTISISNISSNQANSGGTINNNGGSAITAKGICWSTTSNPTTSNSKTVDGSGNSNFTSILSTLNANTTYYVRAYATNGVGTAYGNQVSFVSGATIPSVSTSIVTSSNQNTFSAGGSVTSDGGSTVTSRGICWSTSTGPTISSSKSIDGSGTGSFTSIASGLNANTKYYYRAYATNSIGTSYGLESSITTSSLTIPTIITIAPNSITLNSASSGGNTISDGGSPITAKGVCWNTSGSPTISNSKTIDGTGTSNFISNITGLTTGWTYYVRAYATNAIGTSYGSIYSFTPVLGTPTLNSPINNALISTYFYLNWSCVAGATSYDLQISTSSTFTGTTYSLPVSPGGWLRTSGVMSGTQAATCSSGSVTSDMMQTTTTSGPGTYYFYWRVRARTSTLIGSWSSSGIFKFIK